MKSRWLAKGTCAVAMIAVMGTATICPPPAHAGVPGVFATEYTQLLNYAELVGQLEKQVSMVENQLTQISDMTKHGLTISDQLFGTVASDIANLRQIVNTGQALSYTMSNMDGAFKVRFPGYSSTTNYGQSYQQWSQTSLDSTLGALKAAGLQNSPPGDVGRVILPCWNYKALLSIETTPGYDWAPRRGAFSISCATVWRLRLASDRRSRSRRDWAS